MRTTIKRAARILAAPAPARLARIRVGAPERAVGSTEEVAVDTKLEGARTGRVTFAGIVALVVGGYNALGGLAALSDDDTLTAQATEVLYGIDLTAWGWFWLLLGAVQILAGVLVLQRNEWGRWLAIVIAAVSALVTVFLIVIFPLWAIAVLALDMLVLYALVTREAEFTP